MKAFEIRARRHFQRVKNGLINPEYRPSLSKEHSWQVCIGGDLFLDLDDYIASLALKNRAEARRLVKAPQ